MKTTHRLQVVESRRGNEVYEKFQIVIPRKIIEEAGWHKSDELEFDVDRNGRVTIVAHEPRPKPRKITYELAREALFSILVKSPYGLAYSEIHARAPAMPIKPNPIWVARFEKDLGIERHVEKKTGHKIWRLPVRTITSSDAHIDGAYPEKRDSFSRGTVKSPSLSPRKEGL